AGIVLAMGKYTPVHGWLQGLPGTTLVRWPAKALQVVALGLAILAGLGFDVVLRRREAAARPADGPTLAFLGAWTAAALLLLAVATAGRGFFAWLNGGELPEKAGTAAFQIADLHRSFLFLVLGVAALVAAALRRVPRRVGAALVIGVSFANLHVLSREIQWVGDASL